MKHRLYLAIPTAAVVMFLWSGVSQMLPWGVSSVSQFNATSGAPYVFDAPKLQRAPPETWTTPAFEAQFGDRISTLATDHSFSWIVSFPRERYRPGRFFAAELVSQLVVACLLCLVLALTDVLGTRRRLLIVLLVGAAGSVGTYGVMMNWWGMPARYGVGMSLNLLVGWALAAGAAVLWQSPRARTA